MAKLLLLGLCPHPGLKVVHALILPLLQLADLVLLDDDVHPGEAKLLDLVHH